MADGTHTSKAVKRVIVILPTLFALAYGLFALWRKKATGAAGGGELLAFVEPTIYGVFVSVLVWASQSGVRDALEGNAKRQLKALRDYLHAQTDSFQAILGKSPSPDLCRLLFADLGELPPLFVSFLAKERDLQNVGLETLRNNGRWPLSTARAYEAITDCMTAAKTILIVDQDIRRWYEILEKGRAGLQWSSNTINYSEHILQMLIEGSLDRDPLIEEMRRVFIIPATSGGEASENIDNNSHDVLEHIWDIERQILADREERGLPQLKRFGTRFFIVDHSQLTGASVLLNRINRFRDYVVFDRSICFEEDVLYSTKHSSRLTGSAVLMAPPDIEEREAFFDQLWATAKGDPSLSSRSSGGDSATKPNLEGDETTVAEG